MKIDYNVRFFGIFIVLAFIQACNPNDATTTANAGGTIALPHALVAATLTDGTLKAFISYDSVTPQ